MPLGQGVEQQPSIEAVYQAVRLIWQRLQGGLRRIVLCSLRVVHKLKGEAIGCVLICMLRLLGPQASAVLARCRPVLAQLQWTNDHTGSTTARPCGLCSDALLRGST